MLKSLSPRSRIALLTFLSLTVPQSVFAQSVPAALMAPTSATEASAAVATEVKPAPMGWDALTSADLQMLAEFVIRTPEEHGLFLNASEIQQIQQLQVTNPEAVRATLVPLFISIARQLYAGRLIPTDVGSDIRFKKKSLKEEALQQLVIAAAGSRENLTQALAPRLNDYRMLTKLHARLMQLQAHYALHPMSAIAPVNKPLKLGVAHPAVTGIKERLLSLGFPISNMDNNYDAQTDAAVVDIQRQMKFKPDRIISPGGSTLRYLSTSIDARIEQVRADMEKLRWLPQTPGNRYIFVNLAFSSLVLMDYGKQNPVVFNFKTINGRVERKTPSMVDKIYQVILNPFWTVPPTVFIKDKVEIIKQLGYWEIETYFHTNHFIVVSEDFRHQYSPSSINWNNIHSSKVGFYIRQLPNYNNALGVVKFALTNGEAIYLHDTGERELFGEENRLRSSGCVRVEKPRELAEYVLAGTKWTRYAIDDFVARPGEVLNRETPIDLKEQSQIPVYMLPVTSHYAADGVMRFTTDVYGHNAAIKEMTSFSMF